jgi:NADH-quinone oxidoreductase subunit M
MRLSTQLFPETLGKVASAVVVVGVVNLLVGGVCAVAQRGLRSLLAFVALGELGLLLMGVGSLSQAGFVGAVYQQLVVGLALAALGLLVGVISERTKSELFTPEAESKDSTLGGVALGAPGAALVAAIASASILGVPGVGGFVSHALLVIGGYSFHPFVVIAAGGALLLGTYTILNMYRRVFLGQTTALTAAFEDLRPREKLYLIPVVIALVGFGVYPKPLLDLVRPTVLAMLSSFNGG